MTERRGDVLGSKELKRLCCYISLVLLNPNPLLTFLWLSLMVVTLTCVQNTGQLSGSGVYILQLSDPFLIIKLRPTRLPMMPLTERCVLPGTAPLESKHVHFACHHSCPLSIEHFVMEAGASEIRSLEHTFLCVESVI